MRVGILAIGRLRTGPEKMLCDDYLLRANRAGSNLSLGPFAIAEFDDKRGGGMAAEAALLRAAIPATAQRIVLDERGKTLSSPELARALADWRDQGRRETVFLIGGADGIDPALRGEADLVLSFGRMVWPHLLVRVMLAEQLYRATSILAGSPYHRA